MSKPDLPMEIYLNIFQLLDKSALKECLCVCKRWSYYAAQVYYQDIVLTHYQIGQLSKILTQHPDNNISRWARKITFKRTYRRSRIVTTKRNFHQIFSHLPYLKIICLTDPEKDQWYLESLMDIDRSYISYLQQLNINLNTVLSYNRNIVRLYYNNMARLKDSITHLQLFNLQPSLFKSCGNKDILSYLSQFTRLTHLKVHKPTSSSEIGDSSLPAILESCGNHLQSFHLHDRNDRGDTLASFLENVNYFPDHLSHFGLYITHLFLPYIQYIIQHIPAHQLNTFWLEITDEFLTDWVTSCPSTLVDQFATHLGSIENLNFSTGKDLFSRGTGLTREAIPGCIGAICTIANKIMNKRPLFLEMKMVLNGTHRKPNTCIRVEHNRHMQLKIVFQDPDWYSAEENIDIMDYLDPDMGRFKEKWMVNAFQMIKWHLVPINPTDVFRIFSYMVKQCTHLHHFFITNSSDSFATGPLLTEDWQRDIPNMEYISNLSKAARLQNTSRLLSTKDNLQYISIEHLRVTGDLLQAMVQDLDLKMVRFSGCVFEKDANSNVTLSIGNSVSTVVLNLDAKQYTYIYLEIEINDKCVYYQTQKKTKCPFELLPPSQKTYVYNRYSSKNTIVFRIKGAQLNQIVIKAEYYKKAHVISTLYPQADIIL